MEMYFRAHGCCHVLCNLPEQNCAPAAIVVAAGWPRPSSSAAAWGMAESRDLVRTWRTSHTTGTACHPQAHEYVKIKA